MLYLSDERVCGKGILPGRTKRAALVRVRVRVRVRVMEVTAGDHRRYYPNGFKWPVLPVSMEILTCKMSAMSLSCPVRLHHKASQ